MQALSISQPWTWLIAHGHKDIENRTWTTRYRGPLLLHAPKALDNGWFIRDELFAPHFRDRFGITCQMPRLQEEYERPGIVGIATLVDVVIQSKSRWFTGPYGFVLKDARPLPFIRCRGMLGLFEVYGEVEERVRAYLAEEKEA